MVMVTLDIPKQINKEIEHFKIEHDLKDKRDAIILLLNRCMAVQRMGGLEDIFKEANKMKPIKLYPKDLVRMKKEVYAQ